MLDEFARVVAQQKKTLAPLSDDLVPLKSGPDPLCIAVRVASLDDILGIYPVDCAGDLRFPMTIGEFITLHENASA